MSIPEALDNMRTPKSPSKSLLTMEDAVGVPGDTEQVGAPAGVLDGEQDVEPLEHHGVDGEEIRRQDALGLGSQELGPGRASTWCWSRAMAAEDSAHGRRPDPDAELASSPWTRTQPQLRPSRPRRTISSTRSSALIAGRPGPSLAPPCPPFPASGFSVPTEQRRWVDQESSPAVPREQPAEGSQKGAVDGPVLDAAMDLALKDSHLVTEDDQLDILVDLARRDDTTSPKSGTAQVRERKGHGSIYDGHRRELPAQRPDRDCGALQPGCLHVLADGERRHGTWSPDQISVAISVLTAAGMAPTRAADAVRLAL